METRHATLKHVTLAQELLWAECIWVPEVSYLAKRRVSPKNSNTINPLPWSDSNLLFWDNTTPRQMLSHTAPPSHSPTGSFIFPESHLLLHECPSLLPFPYQVSDTDPRSNHPMELRISGYSHVMTGSVHTLINFCWFSLVNLSSVNLIYRAPAGQPGRVEGGRYMFSSLSSQTLQSTIYFTMLYVASLTTFID